MDLRWYWSILFKRDYKMKNEQEIRDKIKELEVERDECIRRGWSHTLLDEDINILLWVVEK